MGTRLILGSPQSEKLLARRLHRPPQQRTVDDWRRYKLWCGERRSKFVPSKRSDIMVSYGPTEIGGKMYVVPLRSVSITRSRSVAALLQWNVHFLTWGPYETQINVFTFDQYHLFRGTARVLPGFEQVPDKGRPLRSNVNRAVATLIGDSFRPTISKT
jgi:hypothetical protein